jgi:uncharacterized coiled-coil DUF342 family protein
MSTIDQITKQFKDMTELQAFAEAQYRTIIELSKKINLLEEERDSLKKDLANSVSKDQLDTPSILQPSGSDEEIICRAELKKLREKSSGGEELTLEETKRVEIYTKLLLNLSSKDKPQQQSIGNLDTAELMKFLNPDKSTAN